MSLKAFHIVFILVSGLLCLGLGAWSYGRYRQTHALEFAWGIAVSLAALVALIVYGKWFLRKLRNVSYL